MTKSKLNINNYNSEETKSKFFKNPMISRRLVAKPSMYLATVFVDSDGNLKESHIEKKKGDLLLLQITAHLPSKETNEDGTAKIKDVENKQALVADAELMDEIVARTKEGLPCFIQVTSGKGGFYTSFVSEFEFETYLEMNEEEEDEEEEEDSEKQEEKVETEKN